MIRWIAKSITGWLLEHGKEEIRYWSKEDFIWWTHVDFSVSEPTAKKVYTLYHEALKGRHPDEC